jgi:hypothetical protein
VLNRIAAVNLHGLEFEMKGVEAAGVYHAASEREDATKPRTTAPYLVNSPARQWSKTVCSCRT